MECPACHTANPANNRFCENCGNALPYKCATCGFLCAPRARFCGGCGASLADPKSPEANDGSAVAPPIFPSAELKQATVLFADIVSSTELVADLDAEEAMRRLRPAVTRMRQSVERFGGTVVRTLGDGVMALFGVPRALEGHALLACQAALHMQQAFAQGADGLAIRIGLHSGQVASDPEDARDAHGGGAHGFTIHLASRVIALAGPGQICLTEACRAAAGPGCETESMGPHRLKGIPQPVSILRLAGAVSGAPHRTLMPETTFRGRKRELQRLVSALDEARANAGKVIGVSGEPGAGKSRLCQEFAQVCRERGVPVHEVRAQLYGHALPLQPILELFRVHFFCLAGNDAAAVARERIDTCFAPVTSSGSDLRLLHEFFGVAPPDAPPLALGPRARQTRLLALVRDLLRQQAQVERVILIEDMHWLDEASEEFVSALVEAVVGTRTLLLLNYRTTYRAPWTGAAYFEQIELVELSSGDMDALVAELLAPLTALPDICQLVCRRAGGNPFFAEELVRTLAESNLISAAGLPAGGLEAVERALPATIEEVVGARLDRLGEPEKTLLQMCSIIGKEIPLAVLEHVARPIASHIRMGLEGLCQAGLILPQPAGGGHHFAFRHPLIQEVAYRTQLKVRREQVHASVAAAMELYYAEQIDEYAGLIAYHFEQAGGHEDAARYYARSAIWLGSSNAAQSIRHWRKVRSLLEEVEPTPDVARRRASAGAKIATLGWREGMTLAEVKPLIDEALQFANKGDDRLVPWLLTIEGRMVVASGGSADVYADCVRKALMYIDVDRDGGRVALANAFLAQALAWAGLLREAVAATELALQKASQVDPYDRDFIGFSIDQWVLSVRTRALVRMGRMDDAAATLTRLQELEASSGETPLPGMVRLCGVELAWGLGDAALAQQHAAELRQVADKFGTPYLRTFVSGYEGLALAVAGRHDAALSAYSDARAEVRQSGAAREFEPEILAGMAECCLRLGDAARARRHADEAIELSQLRSTRVALLRALIVRASTALALDDADTVMPESDFRKVQLLIEQTGAASWRPAFEGAREGLRLARAG